jgi:hypothetical protein
MARRLFQLSIAAALIIAVGGHWAMLQSVAWVGMALNYAQTDSLEVALKKTFDGQHPCKLCLAVKEGKQQEQKQTFLKIESKLDFLCFARFSFVHPPLPYVMLSPPAEPALTRPHSPPTPPPRRA